MSLRILSVASEAVPLVKTGGLADVAGALPQAVARHGVRMTTLLPGYPKVLNALPGARPIHTWDSLLGVGARLLSCETAGYPLLVLDAPAYFAREGSLYADPSGRDWADNWRRFAALGRAAADIAGGIVESMRFDLLHAHDWQAAMAIAYLRFTPADAARSLPSVMTVHNMAFQGYFDAAIFAALGLPAEAWSIEGVEYYGGVGFLKAGIRSASMVTTVSPSYAAEIRLPEFGMGLEGLIASRGERVVGILNGIDPAQWSPASDPAIAAQYTAHALDGRGANKRALEAEFGLDRDDGPIFIVISRLTWQKGMDVLPHVLDDFVAQGGRLAVLGSGDAAIEQAFHAAALRHPGRIGMLIGYDEPLSHRMQAGGDAILVPSRFEPCGLTQLYALAYGCVPVVARTGGLADTVVDANVAALAQGVATGVQFGPVTAPALATAVHRTIALYRDQAVWKAIQANGMRSDFSWNRSGKAYADLYRQLVSEVK